MGFSFRKIGKAIYYNYFENWNSICPFLVFCHLTFSMVSQKFLMVANRGSICNFQQLSGILKSGPKPWNLRWQDFSLLLTFVVLSVILFFPARPYRLVREKIKIQLFCFSCYTPLSIFFFFYTSFLGNFSIFCKLSSFWALTFRSYIFHSPLFGLYHYHFFLLLYMIFDNLTSLESFEIF